MAKQSGKPKFSIVIAVREIGDYVREAMPYFQELKNQDFEIIIISEKKETESWPKTRIINSGRANPARARNIGVENSKGEIIAFIDDDAYPKEDWLTLAEKEFKNKDIVAVGGPSFPPKNSTFFQKVSNKVYELSSKKTGPRYGRAPRQEIDDWPTCNFFVRKKDFEKTRGFDEKYWGGEDTQICYSLLKTGKRMVYIPGMIIYHHPRKSLGKHVKQTLFWGMWRGFFMRIHKQSRQLVFFIPALFVLWLFFGGILTFFSKNFGYLYLASLIVYVLFLIIKGFQTKSAKLFFPVIFTMFLTQLFYGIGFLR
ncbi:MAG: glycosyltransferase, partial [Candidatus Nanoarchaeia archaeon]